MDLITVPQFKNHEEEITSELQFCPPTHAHTHKTDSQLLLKSLHTISHALEIVNN
jgi:hypothetical protein